MAQDKRKIKPQTKEDEITNDVFMDFEEAMRKVIKADKEKIDKAVEDLKQAKKKP